MTTKSVLHDIYPNQLKLIDFFFALIGYEFEFFPISKHGYKTDNKDINIYTESNPNPFRR